MPILLYYYTYTAIYLLLYYYSYIATYCYSYILLYYYKSTPILLCCYIQLYCYTATVILLYYYTATPTLLYCYIYTAILLQLYCYTATATYLLLYLSKFCTNILTSITPELPLVVKYVHNYKCTYYQRERLKWRPSPLESARDTSESRLCWRWQRDDHCPTGDV